MDSDVKYIVRSGLFLGIAIVLQIIGRSFPQIGQYITGPGINAILLVATFVCGIWWGVAIGLLTPWTAWILGQLPQPLGPFIPFIVVGNAIFVVCFGVFRNYKTWGKYVGFLLGAFLKFGFLYLSALKLVDLFKISLPEKITKTLAAVMGFPQLITALAGGVMAILIINIAATEGLNTTDWMSNK